MDPFSQGLVGAVFSQAVSNKKESGKAAVIGFGAGMLADIDIFIRSSADPLIALEYHRQFTHSLIFIPIGGLIAAIIFRMIYRKNIKFSRILLYSTVGYATHGLLDACTTYGTEILRPFSGARIAWSIISVVDPVFTITLALLVIMGIKRKTVNFSRIGILFCILYLSFGYYQHHKAEELILNAAALRGHTVQKILVHPTLGNLLLWRSIYLSGDEFHVDAVRIGIFEDDRLYQGSNIQKFTIHDSIPGNNSDPVKINDIKRFRNFTNDFLVISPGMDDVIGDIRYSALPNGSQPLWGIKIDSEKEGDHVEMINSFGTEKTGRKTFLKMLKGKDLK